MAADLHHLYSSAQAAWPTVALSLESFQKWAGPRLPLADEASRAERAAELYLCCACLQSSPAALAAFEARYFAELGRVVTRFGAELVDDVKQALRERLFMGVAGGVPKLAAFEGRSGLEVWLRAVATRVAMGLLRQRRPAHAVALIDDAVAEPLGSDDPELAHIKGLYRNEFKLAFADAMASLDAESQNHLRLYYLDGLGLADIAGVFGTSSPTVSRRLSAAREAVLKATRGQLQSKLALSREQLDSLMRLIQSRLTPGDALEQH